MVEIENRMVVDSEWERPEKTVKEVLSTPGYHNIKSNEFVPEDEAYDYALEQCLNGAEEDVKEFRTMLVEWFYSGNWVKEEEQC